MNIRLTLRDSRGQRYSLEGRPASSEGGDTYYWTYSGTPIKSTAIPEVFDGKESSKASLNYARSCLIDLLDWGESAILKTTRTTCREVTKEK